jgi:hypothetical protein
VTVTKGPPTSQPNCAAPCNFLAISLVSFAPNTTYTVSCQTDNPPPAHTFFSFTARTNDAGDYTSRTTLCWYGVPGRRVWATAGGVTSNVVTW